MKDPRHCWLAVVIAAGKAVIVAEDSQPAIPQPMLESVLEAIFCPS
jgi:hypothetical protein